MTTHEELTAGSSINKEEPLYKIGQDVLKYAPSKIIGTIINLMLVSIYTSLLTPQQYGLYNIAIGVLSFLCIIFSDWVGLSSLRFFKEHDNSKSIKEYFSTLLFLLVSNLAIMYTLAFILYKPICDFFKIPKDMLYLVLLLIIPVAARALLFQIFRAQIKPLTYTIFVIINQLTTAIFAIYFIKNFHLGAVSIILGMAFSIVFIDFAMLLISRVTKEIQIEKINFPTLKKFYHYGVPIAVSSLGAWMISQSNKFILQYFKGSYYNGILGVGFNLTYSIIMPLFAIITLAAIPRIFNMFEENKDVNPIITKLTGYYFMVFTPVILILCLFPQNMVTIFSHKSYAESAFLVPALALSVFMYGLSEYTTLQYYLAKKTYISTIIRIASGILGIIINIILIPKVGLWGICISTLVSNGAYLALSIIIRIDKLNWNPPVNAIKKATTSVLICLTAYFAMISLFAPVHNHIFIIEALIILVLYAFSIKLLPNIKYFRS